MTTSIFWGSILLSCLAGAGLGSALTWRAAQRSLTIKLNRTASDLQQRHADEAKELRAAQARAQSELEQARASFKRQLSSAAEGPRAAALKAEERLRAAYDEMDRLRREASRVSKVESDADSNDGFAATRPMPETA